MFQTLRVGGVNGEIPARASTAAQMEHMVSMEATLSVVTAGLISTAQGTMIPLITSTSAIKAQAALIPLLVTARSTSTVLFA